MGLFLWDSEPSKIFVGDTQISKVFLWDTKVRPSSYEYSYDFRNKSIAICQADWWVFSTTSWRTFNSNWITWNSTFWTIMITPSGLSTALSNAKKVTLVIDQFKNSGGSNRWRDLISSSNSQASGSKADSKTIVTRVDATNIYSGNYTISTGEHIVTTIIDLVNKKISIDYEWVMSREDSITDAQVTVVKWLSKLRIQQDTPTIKTVSIKIE